MSWRKVIIESSAKIDYQMGYLVVRKTSGTVKIHLSEIMVLFIESTAVSLSVALLCELMKKKIKVIFCDEKRNPSSELVPYYGAHDTSLKIRNQISWNDEIKKMVWTEIVSEKIRKQAELLERLNKTEGAMLRQYVDEIEIGDITNREGHAAKVYFNALFGMDFTRTAENSYNAALNYGYSLILSSFTREIVSNGYLTQLGLFHDNMFNPFNLASDLMEPFRPLIDSMVYQLKPDKFDADEKRIMIRVLDKEVYISGRKEYVSNAIKIYCKSIFDALNDKDISLITLYQNEL